MSGYVLARRAERDLDSILDYIATESGGPRAAGVLGKFIEAFEALSANPGLGFLRPNLTGEDVRWWPVFSYLVLYEDGAQPLVILRVLHSSRNLERILRG